MNNSIRYDLSARLIHFFREVDTRGKSPVNFPEHWGFDHITENDIFNPFFLLRAAIRHNKIFATWAVRNNRRTIHGDSPAVCFTEMPLAAFIETSKKRSKLGQAISTYGISFLKSEMFDLGARPVIYGLSINTFDITTSEKGERIIDVAALPLQEQYRYVTFNPIGNKKIDWTHEREWRWVYKDSIEEFERQLEEYGIVSNIKDFPSLEVCNGNITDIGVIVETKEEAELILSDILTSFDKNEYTPYKFLFYTEQINKISEILTPKEEKIELQKSMIDLSEFINTYPIRDQDIYNTFVDMTKEIENNFSDIESGELGGCWLWIYDNLHGFTRALINKDRIVVNKEGKYLCFLYEFSDSRSLAQREEMTKLLAARIKEEFNVDCGYFSVLNSNDIDGIPFYCEDVPDEFEDRLFNIL